MGRLIGRSPTAFFACAALALVAGIAVTPAIAGGGISRFIRAHPAVVVATPVDYSGNFAAGVATLEGANTGAGYGVVGTAASSAGIFGFSNTGTGLVGLSDSGFGLSGSSTNNIGLNGFSQDVSGVGGSGPNATYPNAGVFGTTSSASTVANPVGVYGAVPTTGFGLVGDCLNNSVGMPTSATICHGAIGESLGTQGVGVEAFTATGAAAANFTPAPVVEFDNFSGAPIMHVFGSAGEVDQIDNDGRVTAGLASGSFAGNSSTRGDGIDAYAQSGDDGVYGYAAAGNGLFGETDDSFSGIFDAVLGLEGHGGGALIVANNGTADVMSLDASGNLVTAGTITATGSPLIRHTTNTNRKVDAFASTSTMPNIEDFGEAQLSNGHAYVHLGASFADVIDHQTSYLVFITPAGDSRGLYVADRTLSGFDVRESQGGHSTIAFDYRIVAKPADESMRRLPAIRTLLETDTSMHRDRALLRHDKPLMKSHGLGPPHGIVVHAPIPRPIP